MRMGGQKSKKMTENSEKRNHNRNRTILNSYKIIEKYTFLRTIQKMLVSYRIEMRMGWAGPRSGVTLLGPRAESLPKREQVKHE